MMNNFVELQVIMATNRIDILDSALLRPDVLIEKLSFQRQMRRLVGVILTDIK